MRLILLPSLTFVLLFLLTAPLAAQSETNREIGLRLTDLDNPGFIYKKGIAENTFRRYRFFSSSLSYLNVSDTSVGSLGIGGAIGKERRSPIADRLQFARGPEFGLSVNGVVAASQTVVTVRPSFGYVLGLIYEINSSFSVGVETIPTISLEVNVGDLDSVAVNAGFSTNAVAVTVAYRFEK